VRPLWMVCLPGPAATNALGVRCALKVCPIEDAISCRNAKSRQSQAAVSLSKERLLFCSSLRNVPNVPRVVPGASYGNVDGQRYLAMDLLGPSLTSFAARHGGKLSAAAVAHIGRQCVRTA
jgi:hypothetical protein